MIAVISGMGGVVKSTVSINLARALAQLGYRPGILDCDIYGFSVPDLLQLSDPVETQEGRLIPSPRVQGIDVLSMPPYRSNNWR
jgi:ATP-binding protein involved in chromosome partitioning